MSTTKNVVVASLLTNKAKKVVTSATTLGEFKSEISDLWGANVDFIVKPGNVLLRGDDSLLPEGDFSLFIIPTHNKAGSVSPSAAANLGEEIKNAIVSAASKADDDSINALKEDLIETIEDFFGVSLDNDDDDCPECADALEEAKRL